MTAAQSCKSPRRARWLSTSHDKARPDIRQPWQIIEQLMQFDVIRRALVSRFTVEQLVAPAHFKSASSPAPLKFP
jgi:hypothetical protein